MRETSRDYAHPRRPWPLRLGLRLGSLAPAWPPLEPHGLIEAACRAEGGSELGAPDLLLPLTKLCESIDAEARLHTLGRIATRGRLISSLRNRVRAQALFDAHPEILEAPVTAPLVIVGLPRTGTTFLHRMLAAHPELRALRSWEGLNPAPLSGRAERARRQAVARGAERALGWIAPDFFAVHPIEAEGIEEEILLLDMSFLSTVPEATLRVPSFSAWLEQQDQLPAYKTLEGLLQLLQWQEGPGRWVLKTPHHLEWLDVLLEVFPDAKVVHTHRDPVVTAASFCSMIAHGRAVMSDQIDPLEIGRAWERKLVRMVTRAMEARERQPDRFLDVHYDALLADPMAQVRRILAWAEVPTDGPAEATVDAERSRSRQHRFGRHVYDGADFGLTKDGLASAFAVYRGRFGFT